jgi:hypothetical protein
MIAQDVGHITARIDTLKEAMQWAAHVANTDGLAPNNVQLQVIGNLADFLDSE